MYPVDEKTHYFISYHEKNIVIELPLSNLIIKRIKYTRKIIMIYWSFQSTLGSSSQFFLFLFWNIKIFFIKKLKTKKWIQGKKNKKEEEEIGFLFFFFHIQRLK